MSEIAAALEMEAARLLELAGQVRELEANGGEAGNGEIGRLLSAQDLADRTGLPKHKIYALGRRGEAGVVRVGVRGMWFSEVGFVRWQQQGGSL